MKQRPSQQEMIDTLNGVSTGWDYMFNTPGVTTQLWGNQDWINYIGDQWFKVTAR